MRKKLKTFIINTYILQFILSIVSVNLKEKGREKKKEEKQERNERTKKMKPYQNAIVEGKCYHGSCKTCLIMIDRVKEKEQIQGLMTKSFT